MQELTQRNKRQEEFIYTIQQEISRYQKITAPKISSDFNAQVDIVLSGIDEVSRDE